MRKPICLAVILCIALTVPTIAAAAPRPDASPAAHGHHVTILPSCPWVALPAGVKHAYVEEFQHGKIVCASVEQNHPFAATMTFPDR